MQGKPGFRRGDHEIGLPAQERRNLQNIDGSDNRRTLLGRMNICDHRQAQGFPDFREDWQAVCKSQTACGLDGRAVGLVETGLVDQPDTEIFRDFLQCTSHFKGMRAGFQLTGPRNQCQGQITADLQVTNGNMALFGHHSDQP